MAQRSAFSGQSWPRWWRRVLVGARRANIFGVLELVSAATLAVMLVWSWVRLSAPPDPRDLVPSTEAAALLIGTLIPAMTLLVLMGRRIAIRRSGTVARLHVRLVFFFSLVAAVPTRLVAIFASFLFQSGVEFWFSDNSRGILENANRLARGYYEQNQLDVSNQTVTSRKEAEQYLSQHVMEPGVRQFLLKSLYKEQEFFQWRFNVDALINNYSTIMGWSAVPPFPGRTLFIKGQDSEYILPEHREHIASQFPHAKAHMVANTGHWLHAEKPETVNRIILSFLEKDTQPNN